MKKGILIGIIIFGLLIITYSMGLFDKLFGKTEKQEQLTENRIEHKEEWDFYFTNVENIFSSIYLDLGLKKVAPIESQPNVIWVSVKMLEPRDDGLSSQEESERLYNIEDSLISGLRAKYDLTYAGRLTSNSYRDFYFYIGDSTLYDKTISEIMISFPKYEYDFGIKEDKKWGGYIDFLYPLPQQYQSILNRRVIHQLEQGGDNLEKTRLVDHWIYFKSSSDREKYITEVEKQGFSVVNSDYDKSIGEFPYSLHINRIDNVDQNSVDEYVIYLWNLANENNGDYDGWETSIEKNE
jgi:uncharacterized protein (TIGR01619 family)